MIAKLSLGNGQKLFHNNNNNNSNNNNKKVSCNYQNYNFYNYESEICVIVGADSFKCGGST